VIGAAAVLCLAGDTVTRAGLGLTPAPARQRGMAEAEELAAGTLTTRLGIEGPARSRPGTARAPRRCGARTTGNARPAG
jgi:hypothetical protein